ncbi:MAG: class B sortase [Oscillospiraceae bacterium]|nr:class B sortase [Oscillospiraceae bacterium]
MFSSENYENQFDKNAASLRRRLNASYLSSVLLFLVPLAYQYLPCILDGRALSTAEPAPLWMWIVPLIVFFAALVFSVVIRSKITVVERAFRTYCAAETLIIDEEKVYGSTVQGQFSLPFDRIDNVTFYKNPDKNSYFAFLAKNDLLEVKDTAGKSFLFYSFANAARLKAAMERKRVEHTDPSLPDDEHNRFADSVDAYTAHDIQDIERPRQRTNVLSLLVRSLVIALCICVLGYSVYQIADKIIDDRRAAEAYEALRADQNVFSAVARSKHLKEPSAMLTVLQMQDADGVYEDYVPSDIVDPDKADHYAKCYANFLSHANSNPNMYAWIYMTDTEVDYPVMWKEYDNDYYLHHDYQGNESRSGAIFADGWLSPNYYSNKNMVLYGHNMKNGRMFNSVKKWCNSPDIKTLVKTTQIEIYTREGLYLYNIFSYYVDDTFFFDETAFGNDGEYLEFLAKVYKKSYIKTGLEYNPSSRICTLITCTNGSDGDSRYVVHGILNGFISFD